MAVTEKLIAALDLETLATLYTFSRGEQLTQHLQLTTATVPWSGRDYGFDALGNKRAAMVAPGRALVWKFNHPYGVGESWSTVKSQIIAAMGNGRKFYLRKRRSDGLADGTKDIVAPFRLTDIDDAQVPIGGMVAEFTLAFEQYADWQSITAPTLKWDSGIKWDSGLKWDTVGVTTIITEGQQQFFAAINNGDISETEGIVTFLGPLSGPFTLTNYSVDITGKFSPSTNAPMTLTVIPSLAAKQYIAVNSGTGAVSGNIPGIVPWQTVKRAPGQKPYYIVGPGSNTLALTQASAVNGGQVNLFYRDRFRS